MFRAISRGSLPRGGGAPVIGASDEGAGGNTSSVEVFLSLAVNLSSLSLDRNLSLALLTNS